MKSLLRLFSSYLHHVSHSMYEWIYINAGIYKLHNITLNNCWQFLKPLICLLDFTLYRSNQTNDNNTYNNTCDKYYVMGCFFQLKKLLYTISFLKKFLFHIIVYFHYFKTQTTFYHTSIYQQTTQTEQPTCHTQEMSIQASYKRHDLCCTPQSPDQS